MKTIEVKEQMEKWIRKHWGNRCSSFEPGCGVCMAWAFFDFLFQINTWNRYELKVTRKRLPAWFSKELKKEEAERLED